MPFNRETFRVSKRLPYSAKLQLSMIVLQESIQVLALRVPMKRCNELMRKFRGFTLDKPKLKCLVQDGDKTDTKLLLLDDKLTSIEALGEELCQFISDEGLEQCAK